MAKQYANAPLSPEQVSNHNMGLVFEELIRRFAESSNETAGEHFTSRDIVRLTTSLVFCNDDDLLTGNGQLSISVPINLKRRSGRQLITLPDGSSHEPRPWDTDPTPLQLALARHAGNRPS